MFLIAKVEKVLIVKEITVFNWKKMFWIAKEKYFELQMGKSLSNSKILFK